MTENANARIEAFSDAVFAIALTLLIIDIKIPATTLVESNSQFWMALKDISPSIFAFVLSFIIIFITWVNHHNSFKLVNAYSPSSMYANGLLLLTVVFLPFPTALLGEYLFTNAASPVVVLYNAVIAVQSIGWILLGRAALRNNMAVSEAAALEIGANVRYGYIALILYALCAFFAFWFPLTIAAVTTLSWIFWLIVGISIKHK